VDVPSFEMCGVTGATGVVDATDAIDVATAVAGSAAT
jgi:hypothetical protein